jgi:tryptophan synthase alpha chain
VNRIEKAFAQLHDEKRGGFIPFITAGDPDLKTTVELLIELARVGATIIELGVPFSDPMADGPVIQRASERALQHNFGIAEILDVVAGTQGNGCARCAVQLLQSITELRRGAFGQGCRARRR